MGLFDFIFHYGEKFTKDEIKILDRNFNSISAYTKKKYKCAFGEESITAYYLHRYTISILEMAEYIATELSGDV